MTALHLPSYPPFISHCTLQPLAEHPDIYLLDAHYDAAHFTESLFTTLTIPAPEHLQRAVKKRRAEYLASRYCLQQALTSWGIPSFLLRNTPDRAPIWPQGINGSLSHTHQQVCALLTRRQDWLLGVDCERIMTAQVAHETHSMLITAAEKARLELSEVPFTTALTVAFSLKESLYKALYPQVLQFMDFSAAEVIQCSADLQHISLRLTQTISGEMVVGRIFEGRAILQPDQVITWIIGPQQRRD
ncbi:4'-phosphopantetheinyl transferase family protein [Erwinia rhapontici]|uniref:4'-phosphopantetheinyl transferase family protein n=1 Tax=Erwinia rhapontici TaxID=55212 RepID=UPI00216AA4E7|nr:4'-phosphopantetheinyl transferase superfamily protein [Erwinia rhapontici]MCS3607687.1 4'-phosphopantetheinyl transferase EntD [Erwinia rhapontici]